MDNNSTGGNDKRSWRDRLGIGMKEMPRIAEEFGTSPAPKLAVPAMPQAAPKPGAAKPAPRAPQPVVKPAPMAPRANLKIEPKGTPVSSVKDVSQDAFAERLKSQREAAEKMAEQRVQAARQRAETAASQRTQSKNQVKTTVPTDAPAARPKYSFTEEPENKSVPIELPALPRRTSAQVTTSVAAKAAPVANLPPPRPALGMDRPPLPPRATAPAPAPVQQPVANPFPAGSAYRGVDTTGTYVPPPPIFPQRQYTSPPIAPPRTQGVNPPVGRPPYYQNPQQFPETSFSDSGDVSATVGRVPQRPVLRGPMSGPGGIPQGAYADDIFEQPIQRPAQRRGTADEYQNAYRDPQDGFEYEPPKSNGPWVLLLMLLLAGALATAGSWFYLTQISGQPSVTPVAVETKVPAVEPPETAVKTTPEVPAAATGDAVIPDNGELATGGSVVPATTKKQIYDRIVGDREVLGGQIVPTEEVPVVPGEPAPEQGAVPAAEQPLIVDDAAPLPLPPPPGQTGGDSGQQGALEQAPESTKTAAEIPAASESQAADASLAQVVEPVAGEAEPMQAVSRANRAIEWFGC